MIISDRWWSVIVSEAGEVCDCRLVIVGDADETRLAIARDALLVDDVSRSLSSRQCLPNSFEILDFDQS